MSELTDIKPEHIDALHAAAYQIMDALNGFSQSRAPEHLRNKVREKHARAIGQTIYDLPARFTGKVSTSLIDDHGFYNGKKCLEHFYSRLRSGRRIVSLFEEGTLTFDLLVSYLNKYRQVHWVTPAENIALSAIQNSNPHLSHVEHYELCNIRLVDSPPKPPHWFYNTYIIDGQPYENIDQASKATGLDYDTIVDRCASTAQDNVGFVRISSRRQKTN